MCINCMTVCCHNILLWCHKLAANVMTNACARYQQGLSHHAFRDASSSLYIQKGCAKNWNGIGKARLYCMIGVNGFDRCKWICKSRCKWIWWVAITNWRIICKTLLLWPLGFNSTCPTEELNWLCFVKHSLVCFIPYTNAHKWVVFCIIWIISTNRLNDLLHGEMATLFIISIDAENIQFITCELISTNGLYNLPHQVTN